MNRIGQYDSYGTLVKVWDCSIREIARQLGCENGYSKIADVLKGKRDSYHGYKFKQFNDLDTVPGHTTENDGHSPKTDGHSEEKWAQMGTPLKISQKRYISRFSDPARATPEMFSDVDFTGLNSWLNENIYRKDGRIVFPGKREILDFYNRYLTYDSMTVYDVPSLESPGRVDSKEEDVYIFLTIRYYQAAYGVPDFNFWNANVLADILMSALVYPGDRGRDGFRSFHPRVADPTSLTSCDYSRLTCPREGQYTYHQQLFEFMATRAWYRTINDDSDMSTQEKFINNYYSSGPVEGDIQETKDNLKECTSYILHNRIVATPYPYQEFCKYGGRVLSDDYVKARKRQITEVQKIREKNPSYTPFIPDIPEFLSDINYYVKDTAQGLFPNG